jgi:hypothetical protein
MVNLPYVGGKLRCAHAQLYAEPGMLSDELILELAARARQHSSDARRNAQHRRWQILHNQHEPLIQERVFEVQKSEVAEYISEHKSTTLNPAEDIVRAVCAVYKRGVVRRIDGLAKENAAAFLRLTHQSQIDAIGPELNRIAYFVAPVIVLPVLRRGKLRLEIPLPQCTEIVLDPHDPLGKPTAIAFTLGDMSDQGTGADFCTVDAVARRYWKILGDNDDDHDVVEIVDLREEHRLGYFPGAVLRFEVPLDGGDWANAYRHKRLEHGAIDVGRISAHGDYIRRVQNHYLLVVAGDLDALAKGQNPAIPEKPIAAHVSPAVGEPSRTIHVQTLPFDVDPGRFHSEIRFKIEGMAESTGVPCTVTSSGDASFRTEFDTEALTELREQQIAFAREFEHELWVCACDYAHAMRHPEYEKLPTRADVEASLNVEFPELSRKSSDPAEERAQWDWDLSKGIVSFVDIMRKRNPTMDPETAHKRIESNIESNGVVYAMVAAHNAVLDPNKMAIQNAAQINGSLGTPAREANKAKAEEEQNAA